MLHLFSKNSYSMYVQYGFLYLKMTRPKLTVYVLTGDIDIKKSPNYHNLNMCVCQLMEAGAGGDAGVGV